MKVGVFLPVLFVCLQSDAHFLSANNYEPLPPPPKPPTPGPPPKPPTPGPPPKSAPKLDKGRWWCDACGRYFSKTYPKSKHNKTSQHQNCQMNVDIYDEVNGFKSQSVPNDEDNKDDKEEAERLDWEGFNGY